MNRVEKIVYDLVKNSPALKFAIRNVYQMAFDLLPTPSNCFLNTPSVAENSFFGFHDKSPFSKDDTKLLSYRTSIPVRVPTESESLEIGYYDLSSDGQIGAFHHISETFSWNYHKGCRLQWMPDGCVIFNIRKSSSLGCRICSLDGSVKAEYGFPIDTVSADGSMATSFSYERLNVHMPGYGYEFCTDGGALEEKAPESTGLFIADMNSGTRELLFSLKDLLAFSNGQDESDSGNHYVTHTEFSPDGRYVSFLHRWIGADYRKRHSQLIVYDFMEKKSMLMPTTGMVSHYIWNRRNQIVAYCSVKEGDAHVLFNVSDGTYTPQLLGQLNVDGHQSMLTDSVFVTDCYPDRRRMASVFIVDMEKQTKERIGYMYSPRKFQTKDFRNHIACDLHPRVSESGRFVSFDAAFTGKRCQCVMKLK